MLLSILQIIGLQLVLPAAFIFSLWRIKSENKLDWIIQLLFTVIYIMWIFLSGPWDWLGYYVRYVWVILLIPAVFFSWKKTRSLPLRTTLNGSQKITRGIHIVLILVFGLYNVSVFSSYTTQEEAIDLMFPLQDGTYYVGQGGSSTQMNYHHAHEPQQYALDIAKLNSFGSRASGIYPKTLINLPLWRHTLQSLYRGSNGSKRWFAGSYTTRDEPRTARRKLCSTCL